MPIHMVVVVGNGSRGHGSTSNAGAGSRHRRSRSRFCLDSRYLGLGGTTGMGGWALGLPSRPRRGMGVAPICVLPRRPFIYSRRLERIIRAATCQLTGFPIKFGVAKCWRGNNVQSHANRRCFRKQRRRSSGQIKQDLAAPPTTSDRPTIPAVTSRSTISSVPGRHPRYQRASHCKYPARFHG